MLPFKHFGQMIFLEKSLTGSSSRAHCCSITDDGPNNDGGTECVECMSMFGQMILPPTSLLKIKKFCPRVDIQYTNNEHNCTCSICGELARNSYIYPDTPGSAIRSRQPAYK